MAAFMGVKSGGVNASQNGECGCCGCGVPTENCQLVILIENCGNTRHDDIEVRVNGVLLRTVVASASFSCTPRTDFCGSNVVIDDSCPDLANTFIMVGSDQCVCNPDSAPTQQPLNLTADMEQFNDESVLSVNLKTAVNRGCGNDLVIHIGYRSRDDACSVTPTFTVVQPLNVAAGALDHDIIIDNPCLDCSECSDCSGGTPMNVKATIAGITDNTADGQSCPCSEVNGAFDDIPNNVTEPGIHGYHVAPNLPCYYYKSFPQPPFSSSCVDAGAIADFRDVHVHYRPGVILASITIDHVFSVQWRKEIASSYDCMTPHVLTYYSHSWPTSCNIAQFQNSTITVEPS